MTNAMRTTAWAALLALLILPAAAADPPQYGNGSIVGWGRQVFGADLSADFVAVAASRGHSLGLKTDGSIVAWGSNNSGQSDVPAPITGCDTNPCPQPGALCPTAGTLMLTLGAIGLLATRSRLYSRRRRLFASQRRY